MKVSFLVTYYNQEQYVRQSMDSILSIEKPDEWEILVGDDGSTDKTVDIVNEYMKNDPEHIFLHIMPREKGKKYDSVKRASANRINLLKHCKGECFCTLDGDDFFINNTFVNKAIAIFEEHKDASVVAFGFRYYRNGVLEEGQTLDTRKEAKINKNTYLKKMYIPAGACVHRVKWDDERIEHLKKIGYFDDNDIIINSLNYGEMYSIPNPIYAYRQIVESTYNKMNQFEQAVLNVQGFDVDRNMISTNYLDGLIVRNTSAIFKLYFLRYKAKDLLDESKIKKYIEGSRDIPNSICYLLLNPSEMTLEEKKRMRRLVFHAFWLRPQRVIKLLLANFTLRK